MIMWERELMPEYDDAPLLSGHTFQVTVEPFSMRK